MRVTYDRDADAPMMGVPGERISHAEEADPVIMHFDAEGRPVLLEMLDASEGADGPAPDHHAGIKQAGRRVGRVEARCAGARRPVAPAPQAGNGYWFRFAGRIS